MSATSVTVGTNVRVTVTLTEAAETPVTIALSSSNTTVALIPGLITVQGGASSATINFTPTAAGAATITAALNGSSQSATLSVTPGVALSSITLSPSSVVGGTSVTGTATLNGAAPAGGAAVALSGGDPASLPSSVTVPSGSTSATFLIGTRIVTATTTVAIAGSYGGVSKSAVLTVRPQPTAIARFGVSGPTTTETCTLTNNGLTIDCTFNGSTSTAPGTIVAYDWTYGVATKFSQTTTGPVLMNPAVDCTVVPPPPLPSGDSWLTMTVTLVIHDSLGNVSPPTVDDGVRLFPQGSCGY